MLSSRPAPSAPPSAHNVTSDPRHLNFETYWKEVQSIDEEEEEEEEEEERKSMDEVELEEAWLKEAGLCSLLTGASCCSEEEEALLSTLSRKQAATVRTRLDNYTQTLRGRSHRQPIRDVRDVFTESCDDSAEKDPTHHSESPTSRFHTNTKTIRRNRHTVRPTLPLLVLEEPVTEQNHPEQTFPEQTLPEQNRPEHNPIEQNGPEQNRPEHNPIEQNGPEQNHPEHNPIEQNRPEKTLPSQEAPPSLSHTHLGLADWMLRATPYSESMTEHGRGGACVDCLRFYSGDVTELQLLPVSLRQGLTCADDLSSCDLTRLGFISHIELSTCLSALGVQIKRIRPPRRRTRDSGVFGVSLNSLLENDRKKIPGIKVPVIFQKLLCILQQSGLHTEGILRVSGSAARLKYLRRELDRCCGTFDWSAVRQVDASGLLKLFIRELPVPLLTHKHLSTYLSLQGLSSELHQIQALQLLTLLLPESHRDTLRDLLVFLRQVVAHQDQNRMSLWNVSMVMAPNLFVSRHHGNKKSVLKPMEQMEEAVGGANLLRLMISYQDLLWMVPSFLLAQVRQMNQVSNQKQLSLKAKRLLRRWTDKDQDQVTELCEGVIRVHAPWHNKVSMAIQLHDRMTAEDVTSRFQSQDSVVQHLYEVGGNICERRLRPDCVLLDVYRVNPHCDWLVKP